MTDPSLGGDVSVGLRAATVAGQPEETLGCFGDLFAAGCAAGAVTPLPRDDREARALPAPAERTGAARDRLQRLGYRTPGDAADPAPAVAAFQREAGLPDHGCVDVATWDALQALFTFEKALVPDAWFDDAGRPRPPLVRAVRLRLSVLGFGEAPDAPAGNARPGKPRGPRGAQRRGRRPSRPAAPGRAEPETAAPAFQAMEAGCADLGLEIPPPAPPAAPLTPERVAWLFDHEGLVARLARVDRALVGGLPRERRERAETLLICAAKIELWLFGYPVRPDGDPELGFRARRGRPGLPPPARRFNQTRTARALREFLSDIEPGASRVPLPGLPAELPRLFEQALALRARAAEEQPKAEASHVIVDALVPHLERDPGLLARVVRGARDVVGRLFDGIRRVIAWVGNLFRRGAGRVVEQAVNLWRTVYHFSGLVAFRLRQAIDAFAGGVRFLFSPWVPTEPAGHGIHARRGDFDACLALDDNAAPAVVAALGRRLLLGARQLTVACRLVALAVRGVRRLVVLPGLGPLGYASLVLGLGRAYSEVREIGALLDALEAPA